MCEYKKSLKEHLPVLVENTNCSETVIVCCVAINIISTEEADEIRSITMKQKQNSKFWNIVSTRTNCIQALIGIFSTTQQNTIVAVLDKCLKEGLDPVHSFAAGATETTNNKKLESFSTRKKYGINLAPHGQQKVLGVLQFDVRNILQNPEQNDMIVSAITAENIVDRVELTTIIENDRRIHRSEGQRMSKLMEIFQNKPIESVEKLLTLLVNLENNEFTAGEIRKKLEARFPMLIIEK